MQQQETQKQSGGSPSFYDYDIHMTPAVPIPSNIASSFTSSSSPPPSPSRFVRSSAPTMNPPISPNRTKPSTSTTTTTSHSGIPIRNKSISSSFDSDQVSQLMEQGYSRGLVTGLEKTLQEFPLRIWIVDNSGSMNQNDGHRFIETHQTHDVRVVSCSRWQEIVETVQYHSQLAALLQAPTIFRFLNHVAEISIACQEDTNPYDISLELSHLQRVLKTIQPNGPTPLTQHIHDIQQKIVTLETSLRSSGQRVAIVIATDGLPTSSSSSMSGTTSHEKDALEEFIQALRSLEHLPVWVVIRLCSDEDRVREFYNSLDSQLELSIEVLDDFISEATEIHEKNPWINYSLPIHRMREFGSYHRIFDLLDERLLTMGEVRDYCLYLFGSSPTSMSTSTSTSTHDGTMTLEENRSRMDSGFVLPDPQVDYKHFTKALQQMVRMEKSQWDPIRKKVMPLIDMHQLQKQYADRSSCSIV